MPYSQSILDIVDYARSKLGYPVVSLEVELVNPNSLTELVFTGNGVTQDIVYKTYDRPIKSGSVYITATLYDSSSGSDVEAVLSDSHGSLVGTGGDGSVNYFTGDVNIHFHYPVKAGTQVFITYLLDNKDWIYAKAVENAFLWYSARRGLRKMKFLQLEPGVDTYTIDEEPVMRVVSLNMGSDSPIFVWEEFGFPYIFPMDTAVLSYNWTDYYSVMHLIKRLKKYYSIYYRWEFVPDRNIKIYPAPQKNIYALVDYRVALTEDRLPFLQPVEYILVRDYAYAYILESLGRIRGKYTSYPVVGGEAAFGGVDELLEEAKTLYEKLNREIAELAEPLPILIE